MIKSKILRNYNIFGSQLETRGENLPLKIFQRHVVNPIVRRRFGRSVVPYGTLDVVPERRSTGRYVPDTVGGHKRAKPVEPLVHQSTNPMAMIGQRGSDEKDHPLKCPSRLPFRRWLGQLISEIKFEVEETNAKLIDMVHGHRCFRTVVRRFFLKSRPNTGIF